MTSMRSPLSPRTTRCATKRRGLSVWFSGASSYPNQPNTTRSRFFLQLQCHQLTRTQIYSRQMGCHGYLCCLSTVISLKCCLCLVPHSGRQC